MDKTVKAYFEKQKTPQKEICLTLRSIILKTFPEIEEAMKWGVPAYATDKFYIVALKDHVNLGFSLKGLTKEEIAMFDGGGKTMKHIKVHSQKDLDEKRIIKLLKLVMKK